MVKLLTLKDRLLGGNPSPFIALISPFLRKFFINEKKKRRRTQREREKKIIKKRRKKEHKKKGRQK